MSLPDITDMLALSVQQPWPHHMFYDGKDVENRSWATKVRGLVLIHASKKFDGEKVDAKRYPKGGIVGIVELVDCVRASDSPWYTGEYGFVLRHAIALPLLPVKGALKFFKPDAGALVRGIVAAWGREELSEGQCCALLNLGRVEFRTLCDAAGEI